MMDPTTLLSLVTAAAEEAASTGNYSLAYLAAGIGAGLVVIGAGAGIGKLASSAMDGTARQPSAAGAIRTTAIILSALIEGVALFGEVICILLAVKK